MFSVLKTDFKFKTVSTFVFGLKTAFFLFFFSVFCIVASFSHVTYITHISYFVFGQLQHELFDTQQS